MSKNRQRRNQAARVQAQAQAQSGKRFMVGDSFANFEARVGIGTNNQSAQATYQFDYISRNRVQMEAMYRSSWIVGQAVDVVAEDMTRAGIDLSTSLSPEDQEALTGAFERMQLWDRLCDNIKWSRLYGGSIAVMLIDGQDLKTPLRLDSIARDQFKGLMVLDRWLVQPTLNQLVKEYGPSFGMPEFYDVVADGMALTRQLIHHSRVIRMDGVDLPYWQKIAENLWGQSVIERLFDRLVAFDSTTQGAAQLVYKAHLRTMSVEGLREIIGMGGPPLEGLLKNIEMIRRFQSNEGLTLLDAKDKFEAHQYAFSGLSDLMLQFGQQLSGALQIPLVRLFGQSPAGLNSTGNGEMKQYHENIAQQQERRLRPGVTTLLEVLCRSELGKAPPKGFKFEFNSLEQMSDKEKAEIGEIVTRTVLSAEEAGLISQQTALKELRQASEVSGVWSNITDELINAAEDELPDLSETLPDANANQGPPEAARTGESEEGGDPIRRAA
jgi:phage-related protein (TIGR01555 family)